MRILAKSDIGKAREMNQDSYFVSDPEDEIQLFILADGMGGYKGGEIASSLAIESTRKYIANNFKKMSKSEGQMLKLINSAVEYANMVVHEKAQEDKELRDMGTTLEVCLIYNSNIFIGHVGDSRIYRIRKNNIEKITNDHSYVEKLVREGSISREEAHNHPKKNMLMKAIGCHSLVEPDVMLKDFIKDDIILICSDGLTNMLNDDEIYSILLKNPDNPVDALIDKANKMGGYDNITAIIIDNIDLDEKTKER